MNQYDSLNNGIVSMYGSSVSIVRRTPVGGGDINDSSLLELSDGKKLFMKANSLKNAAFFEAEQHGIEAIESTGAIKVPKLLFRGADKEQGFSFLVMECINGGSRVSDFWEEFGHSLAGMHLADTGGFVNDGKFGFYEDNFIGASPQINSGRDTWIDFFRECRLEVQFEWAVRYFDGDTKKQILKFLDKLPEYLIEPEKPSLLHGDLWSGNYMVGDDGKAWLIDPAVYVGHAEADLAMTELFGRFPDRFYEAYSEVNPIAPGYRERRDIYNLYHLLNHLNLFGPAYLSGVVSTVLKYV